METAGAFRIERVGSTFYYSPSVQSFTSKIMLILSILSVVLAYNTNVEIEI